MIIPKLTENDHTRTVRIIESDPYLNQRGVAQAAAAMGVYHHIWFDDTQGYGIPVSDNGGQRDRFRAAGKLQDGSKTRWIGEAGSYTPRYYNHPEIRKHVADTNGKLIIASGEFDLLTFHMLGHYNVVTFSSENAIPADLVEQLSDWNVSHVDYYPDLDRAGLRAARRLHDKLTDGGFTFNAYSLEGHDLGKGGDVNDLWQALGFDHTRMLAALEAAPLAALPDPEQPRQKPQAAYTGDSGDFPADYTQTVINALLRQPGANQKRNEIILCSLFREDKNPSLYFNVNKLTAIDRATGQGYGIVEIGRQLGIDISNYRGTVYPAKTHKPKDSNNLKLSEPIQTDTFRADVTYNVRYCSEIDLSDRTIALKSPLNTGKTKAVISLIQKSGIKRVLFLTHLQALTADQIERLHRAGVIVEDYKSIPTGFDPGAIDRFVCSLNSVPRLHNAKPYDLVIFDESTQGIPHLWGGTLRGKAISEAFQTIEMIFKQAGQVIALDAHQNNAIADWMKSLRGDCTRIENIYRHQWGDLIAEDTEAGLISAAMDCAGQDQGTVVITAGSRTRARVFYRLFADRYGSENVRVIHGWNSHSQDSRQFIKNINQELPKLRVFIASPTIGTGVNITAHVAGVFGYFPLQPLTANQIMQQMARYRNASERRVFIPYGESDLTTNPEKLLQAEREKLLTTAKLAKFDRHNITRVTMEQAGLTKLWAEFTALHNQQRSNLRDYTLALASNEGFKVKRSETEAPQIVGLLKELAKTQKETDNQSILTEDAQSPNDLEILRDSGQLEEIHYLGLERWKIEHTTGQSINQELLTDYRSPRERAALRRFTDYIDRLDNIRQKDRENVEALPFQRGNYTAHRTLFEAGLQAVFGDDRLLSTEQISASELTERVTFFIEANLKSIQLLLDKRTDLSEKPIAVFRRLLKRFHIRLDSHQVRVNGEKMMVYSIDQNRLALIRERARVRLIYLEKLSKNTEKERIYIRDFRQAAEERKAFDPPGSGKHNFAAMMAQGIPINPFAGATA